MDVENVWRFLGSKEAAELLGSVPNEPICAKAEVNFKKRTSSKSLSTHFHDYSWGSQKLKEPTGIQHLLLLTWEFV